MKKITTWRQIISIKNEKGMVIAENIVFNHIEDGWSESPYPLPIHPTFTNQQAWKSMKWKKQHAYLNEASVVVYEDKEII